MYKYNPQKDSGILWTALSNYRASLEKDLKEFSEGMPENLIINFTDTISRIDVILEDL